MLSLQEEGSLVSTVFDTVPNKSRSDLNVVETFEFVARIYCVSPETISNSQIIKCIGIYWIIG